MNNTEISFFCATDDGPLKIKSINAISGDTLAGARSLKIVSQNQRPQQSTWQLAGLSSHIRYTKKDEVQTLRSVQTGLGRKEATVASLIPIKKSEAWWALAQDERRAIFEEQSQHISYSLKYLPEIARKLYHSRDLGEPFDFLTWFEFAPEHEEKFNQLLKFLRASKEWSFVTREVDVRLSL